MYNLSALRRLDESKDEPSIVRKSVEDGIKVVRETCCDCVNSIKAQKKPIDQFVATGIDHSQCAYKFT